MSKDRVQTAVHELLNPVDIAGRLSDAPGNYEVSSVSDSTLVIRSGPHGEYHKVVVEPMRSSGSR